MKIPKIFIPEKDLEANLNKMLSEKPVLLKHHEVDFDKLKIDCEVKTTRYLTFDSSLRTLKKEGYDRHLYPWEVFDLLINRLENKLNQKLGYTAQTILASDGEWLNVAVERKGKKLVCYVNPENLKWNQNLHKYIYDGNLEYDYKKELSIGDVPSYDWVGLKSFNDEFSIFFYNRELKDMSEEIQKKSAVYFPGDSVIWPIARGSGHGLYICGYVDHRVCRGVKQYK